MQDPIGIPACFSSGDKPAEDAGAISRSGQSVCMSIYRTKIAGQCRLITITWCRNVLLHGLSVSVEGLNGGSQSQHSCKIELKPWSFWRKQGSKRFVLDDKAEIDIFWDLKAAKFHGETEPKAEYYVAVACNEEIVLLLGDLRTDAYRKTGCRPSLIDPILVSKREHIFAKKKFITRAKFHEKGRFHEISIECKCGLSNGSSSIKGMDPEMEIRIDGLLMINVKHLQWKFRGNEMVRVNRVRVEVFWDVHDWLFSPGLRHALFIFKPHLSYSHMSPPSLSSPSPLSMSATSKPLSSQTGGSGSAEGISTADTSSDFCLFLYAWKVE